MEGRLRSRGAFLSPVSCLSGRKLLIDGNRLPSSGTELEQPPISPHISPYLPISPPISRLPSSGTELEQQPSSFRRTRRYRISAIFCRLVPTMTVEVLREERVVHAFCAPIAAAQKAPRMRRSVEGYSRFSKRAISSSLRAEYANMRAGRRYGAAY